MQGARKRVRGTGLVLTTPVTRVITRRSLPSRSLISSVQDVTSTSPSGGSWEVMEDVVTPNFRKVQAEGGMINSPMRRSKEVASSSGTGFTAVTNPKAYPSEETTEAWTGDVVGRWFKLPEVLPIDTSIVERLKTAASTAAHAGVADPNVQGMVALAELKKTLEMLRNPMSGLTQFIALYRRKKTVQGIGPTLVGAANCWAEARFGWRPFLLEMEALIETLKDGKSVPRQTSRATRKQTTKKEVYLDKASYATGGYLVDLTFQHSADYEVRSGILWGGTLGLSEKLGFRWADLPATAWELIPFSFVVDWIVNVGDVINAFTPKAGIEILAQFESVRVKRTVTRICTRVYHPSPTLWDITVQPSGVATRTVETYERVPRTTTPGFVLDLDITSVLRGLRTWDALALLIQQLYRK